MAAVLFVVLNAWFVFPHFSDLGHAQKHRADALEKINRWQAETDHVRVISGKSERWRVKASPCRRKTQENQFSRAIQDQQAQSGVDITSTSENSHPAPTSSSWN